MMQFYWHKLSFIALLVLSFPMALAQRVEKKLVLTLPDTFSKPLDQIGMTIDTQDNYCYYPQDGHGIVVTNKGTYGPFEKVTMRSYASAFYKVKDKDQYIKGKRSTVLIGPIDGEIEFTLNSNLVNDYFAYTVSVGDSASYYVNEIFVGTAHVDPAFEIRPDWCVFSDNGTALYTIAKGQWNYLFLNYKLIDSSKDIYGRLGLDDQNNYRYTLGSELKYGHWFDYKPYKHAPQRVFGPVAAYGSVFQGKVPQWDANGRIVRDYDDSFFYYGNSDGEAYHLENDSLYQCLHGYGNILVPGKGKHFLIYPRSMRMLGATLNSQDTATWMIANGKILQLPYSEIYSASIDSLGNYAFFGLRDHYLYKNINGIEQVQPLSIYGVRATPVSIDAYGNTICFYQTDDSTYVYENDRLFNKCANAHFDLLEPEAILGHIDISFSRLFRKGEFSGFCMDDSSYIVYKNAITPIPKIKNKDRRRDDTSSDTGVVECGDYSAKGYWLIQKTGDKKYVLLINNRLIPLPPEVEFEAPLLYTLSQNFRLTDEAFIFYSKEGNNIWCYKINL